MPTKMTDLEKKTKDQISFNHALHKDINKNIKDIIELDSKYDNRTHLTLNRVRNNEEVLRDHIKWHQTPTYMGKQDEKGELDKQLEKLDGKKDCNKCDLYGECDHQGAYQKDGKWCYETPTPDAAKFGRDDY